MIKEEIKVFVLQQEEKGNIVLNDPNGLLVMPLKDIINQPIEGLLYDLNRDKMTILTFIPDPKWINDYACMQVITELKRQVEQLTKENK